MLPMLHDLFVLPLMQLYGILFDAPGWAGPGWRIMIFSVVINLLLMPVYGQMERRSRAARAKRTAVATDVARIRRHFRGRERYFYIRAVHRQHGYRPLSQLFTSGDLQLQILVFLSVYHFLAGRLDGVPGTSFGPLRDLSQPDALVGGLNLLPLLMTAINVASVISYVDDRARQLQAASLALVFLVILYPSPAGLVLYWTMNNLFSLIRNLLARHCSHWTRHRHFQWLVRLQQQQ